MADTPFEIDPFAATVGDLTQASIHLDAARARLEAGHGDDMSATRRRMVASVLGNLSSEIDRAMEANAPRLDVFLFLPDETGHDSVVTQLSSDGRDQRRGILVTGEVPVDERAHLQSSATNGNTTGANGRTVLHRSADQPASRAKHAPTPVQFSPALLERRAEIVRSLSLDGDRSKAEIAAELTAALGISTLKATGSVQRLLGDIGHNPPIGTRLEKTFGNQEHPRSWFYRLQPVEPDSAQ